MSALTRAALALAITGAASGCAALLDFQQPDDGAVAATASSDASSSLDATPSDDATRVGDPRDSAGSDSPDADGAVAASDAAGRGSDAEAEGGAAGDDAAAGADADAALPATGACVSAPPAAWDGPFAVDEMNGNAAPPPSCPADYPQGAFDGFDAPIGAAPVCSCACSAPAGATCGSSTISYYGDSSCQQPNGNTTPASASCTRTDKTAGAKSLRMPPPAALGGACSPALSATVPPLQITASVRLCATAATPAQGACGIDEVALPPVAFPFEKANACIARDGSWMCPASYPIGHTYYAAVTDARACSACVCDAPTATTCTMSATGFTDNACTTAKGPIAADVCTTIGSTQAVTITASPTGGSCTAHGGVPTGVVTPSAPKTVCCVL